jgi:hypothetical protein
MLAPALGAATTVSVAIPKIFPEEAVIVVAPAPTEVAMPFVPVALLMVATEVFDELQVTEAVRS